MLANATFADATLHSQANAKHADTYHDLPSKEAQPNCSVLADDNVDGLAKTDAKLAGLELQNAVCNGSNEASMSNGLSGDGNTAKQSAIKSDHEYYNLTKSQMRTSNDELAYACLQSLQGIVSSPANQNTSGCQVTNGKTPQNIQSNEQEREESDMYASLTKNKISSPDSPWVKLPNGNDQNHVNTIIQDSSLHQQQVTDTVLTDAMLTEPAEKHGSTEDDSSYWNLSGTNQVPHRLCRGTLLESIDKVETHNNSEMQNQSSADRNPMTYSDVTQSERVFKSARPIKLHSPEKPTPPKKPDLCALGLMASSEANTSPGSSPHKQKPMILHNKPDLSLTSPRKTKPLFASKNTKEAHSSTSGTCGTLEITGISHNQNTTGTSSTGIMGITGSRNKLTGIMTTLENCGSSEACCTMGSSNLGTMANKMWTCVPSGIMGVTQAWSTNGATNTTDGTMSTLEDCDTLGNSGDYGVTSAQTGGTQSWATDPCRLYKDNPKTFYKRMMRSSLAEDEDEEEDEKVEERAIKTTMMMMLSSTKKRDKARKRRKRRTGRQLLMMSSTMEPSPSSSSSSSSSLSSSSSSSSSGDEHDVVKGRTLPTSERVRMMKKVCDEETSDSESSCAQTGQSRYSLSSALSTESLREELSLPDLLIEETGEEEEEQSSNEEAQRTEVKAKETRPTNGKLFSLV